MELDSFRICIGFDLIGFEKISESKGQIEKSSVGSIEFESGQKHIGQVDKKHKFKN